MTVEPPYPSMPHQLYMRDGQYEYIFPTFKFLSAEHSEKLLDCGNVHLPTFNEFRDPARYSGKILDLEEGKVKIINHYRYYEGLAKNANGLIPIMNAPYHNLAIRDATFDYTLSIEFGHLYCTAKYFFSDSLKWAVSEGKTHCVLIRDFRKFVETASQSFPELEFVGVDECDYSGRSVEEYDPGTTSITN